MHQLLKLPLLIHHYLEHQNTEQDKSFTHFLSDHYSKNPEHSEKDSREHEKLPFKTADCTMTHISLAFVNTFLFSILRPIAFHEKISPIYNGAFYSSTLVSNIWQPPKFS